MPSARVVPAVAAAALAASVAVSLPPAWGAGSVVSGTVFRDDDRDGVRDAGEAPFAGQVLMLFNAAGTNVASAQTGADGSYAFGSSLSDGTYTVRFSTSDWWALRSDYVPTTTGSRSYARTVSVVGGRGTADFGLRPIVRSTDLDRPLSTATAANGAAVRSYNDALPAQEVATALDAGQLYGDEARTATVYVDLGTQTDATTSVSGTAGGYSDFRTSIWLAYLSWLDRGDTVLFHEYGHAWGLFNLYLRQQTDSFDGYLRARGVLGDPRVGASRAWDPSEMLAEDYRQLFGSPNAVSGPQANTDLPRAADVAGLRDYLRDTFTRSPDGGAPAPAPAPEPAPAPQLAVGDLLVNPAPVSRSGTVSFSVSTSASVTVSVVDGSGALVRRLLDRAPASAGSVQVVWDRKNAAGRKVRAGRYTVVVVATGSGGASVTAQRAFDVV